MLEEEKRIVAKERERKSREMAETLSQTRHYRDTGPGLPHTDRQGSPGQGLDSHTHRMH